MDLSLKQRLLGAIVLIALAVIFVPMLLTGPAPKSTSETVNLAIPPAPDREFQNRVLPVDGSAGDSAPGTATPAGAPPAPAASASPDRFPTVDTATAPPPVQASPAPETAPAKTESPPPVAETTKPEAKESSAAPGRAADGRYFVHLGVYAENKNADDLVASLKKGGFPAFAEATTFQGKSAEQVRVGPYADRAAAEAARLRIKQQRPRVPGSVVESASDATADAPASALPADRAGGWAVQLGAFGTNADAMKLRDRLKNAGFVAFVDKVASDGKTLWRVRAGPEADRGNADKLRGRIKDKLKIDGIVVTQ